MVEVLRILVGVLVVASFGHIAVYVFVSLAVAASTLVGAARRDRLADELDQVLIEILGPRTPQRQVESAPIAVRAAPLSTPGSESAKRARSLLTDDRVFENHRPTRVTRSAGPASRRAAGASSRALATRRRNERTVAAGDVGQQRLVKDMPGAAERRSVAAREGQLGPFGVKCRKSQLALEAWKEPGRPGRFPGERDDESLVGPFWLTEMHRDNFSEPGWPPWPDANPSGLAIG